MKIEIYSSNNWKVMNCPRAFRRNKNLLKIIKWPMIILKIVIRGVTFYTKYPYKHKYYLTNHEILYLLMFISQGCPGNEIEEIEEEIKEAKFNPCNKTSTERLIKELPDNDSDRLVEIMPDLSNTVMEYGWIKEKADQVI